MTAEWINAAAGVMTAAATTGLLIVAWYQTSAIRHETRKWETVKICNQYDTDPVLFQCAKAIRERTLGKDYSLGNVRPVLQEIRTLLNYYDSVAVGVAQGVYIESIVRDNLELVVSLAVDKFMTHEFRDEIDVDGLLHLSSMRKTWQQIATKYNDRNPTRR